MRITKVSVKKLFGIFDHEIPLNQESRITIIHGPNGFGKTILLTMLNGLFNSNYRVFLEVPFVEFRVYIDHHEFLALRKENDELELMLTNVTGTYTMDLAAIDLSDPDWLGQIRRVVNVELIKTQRLQTEVADENDALQRDSRSRTCILGLAVEDYAAKTARFVHNVRGARTLTAAQFEEIESIHKEVETLLNNEKQAEQIDHLMIKESLKYVESTLDTIFERMTEADKMGSRLMMLVELLNRHYSYKRVYSDAKSGLVVVTEDGKLIPVASLSSGEQHQLILFSTLLFDIPQNSLVLIDEPELSLHVTWQHDFLNDLKRIIDLCDFDVLIATHSPQIVHDKWDWMIDLHNPEADYSDDVAEYA